MVQASLLAPPASYHHPAKLTTRPNTLGRLSTHATEQDFLNTSDDDVFHCPSTCSIQGELSLDDGVPNGCAIESVLDRATDQMQYCPAWETCVICPPLPCTAPTVPHRTPPRPTASHHDQPRPPSPHASLRAPPSFFWILWSVVVTMFLGPLAVVCAGIIVVRVLHLRRLARACAKPHGVGSADSDASTGGGTGGLGPDSKTGLGPVSTAPSGADAGSASGAESGVKWLTTTAESAAREADLAAAHALLDEEEGGKGIKVAAGHPIKDDVKGIAVVEAPSEKQAVMDSLGSSNKATESRAIRITSR